MDKLRADTPKTIGGKKVVAVRDYLTSERVDNDGNKEEILLPKSNVLYLELEGGSNFVIRPSGTEPKIKLYCLLRGEDRAKVDALAAAVKKDIEIIVK